MEQATYRCTVYPWQCDHVGREKSIRFVHEMRNAETGEIAATCEMTGVHMDRAAQSGAV